MLAEKKPAQDVISVSGPSWAGVTGCNPVRKGFQGFPLASDFDKELEILYTKSLLAKRKSLVLSVKLLAGVAF